VAVQAWLVPKKSIVVLCTQPYKYSRRLWAALLAEFIGMTIFQIYGGSANDEVAAFGNGLTLAVVSKPLPYSPHNFMCDRQTCW